MKNEKIQPHLQVRALGKPLILCEGKPIENELSKKALSLLVYLIAAQGKRYLREELAGLFWGNLSEDRANYNFRRTLWELRRKVNPAHSTHDIYIRYENEVYYFDPKSEVDFDVYEFEQATRLLVDFPSNDLPNPQTRLDPTHKNSLEKAVLLYRGDFFHHFRIIDSPAFEDWLFIERDRLRLRYVRSLHILARHYVACETYVQAIDCCQKLLKIDPTDELAHRELMLIYSKTNNREGALQQYNRLAQVLKTQLGVEPLPETQNLYAQIRDRASHSGGLTYSVSLPPSAWVKKSSFPFVGRRDEFTSLQKGFQTVKQGLGRVVAVSGEAGVGKTRLMEEFITRFTASKTIILQGRCYFQHEGLPYQPIIDAIRTYLPYVSPDYLSQLDDIWLADLVKLLPELNRFISHSPASPTLHPDQERNRLFEGVAQFLIHLAQKSPLILFIDDLHSADPETLAMLHYLGRRLARSPVMILLAYQSNPAESDSLLNLLWSLKRAGCLSSLPLTRLPEEEVSALVRQTLPEGDRIPELTQRLLTETGGNAFFLIETIRAIKENRGQPADRVPISNGIREVVKGRFFQLAPLSRDILSAAAVFGSQFSTMTLQRIFQLQAELVLDGVAELIRTEWIEPRPGGIASGIYDFSHGIARQVVIEMLLPQQLQQLHLKIAQALEAVEDPEGLNAGVLFYHYWQGRDLVRAQENALKAGESARRIYAYKEAKDYFAKAFQTVESGAPPLSGERRIRTLITLGELYQLLGEYEAAIQTYLQAAGKEGAEQTGRYSDPLVRQAYFQLALTYDRKGDYGEAMKLLALLETETAKANDDADHVERARIAWGMALIHLHREQSQQALALCNQALAILAQLPESDAVSGLYPSIYQTMASSYFHMGRYTTATNHYEIALKFARAMHLEAAVPRLLIGLGNIARRVGNYKQAEAYALESIEICQKIGLVQGLAAGYGTLGNVAYNAGDLEKAYQHFHHSLAIHRQIGDQHGIADYCISLAFVLIDLGELDHAERYLNEAHQVGLAIEADLVIIRSYHHLARIAFRQGNVKKAHLYADKAIRIAEKAGIPLMLALSSRLLAEILTEQGQYVQAEQLLQKSLSILERLGDRFEVAWALRSYARLLKATGHEKRSLLLLQQAMNIFRELGAEREYRKTSHEFEMFDKEE